MRLIDADALLDKVQDYGEGKERLMLIDPYWVRTAPTVERPHGEWITKKDSLQTYCSHCDTAIPYSDEYDFSDFIICPYCGADMRKEGESN